MLTKEAPRAAVEPLSLRYKGAPQPYLTLLGQLLRFDPARRMTCAEALADPAFADIRDLASELRAAQPVKGDFDEEPPAVSPAAEAAVAASASASAGQKPPAAAAPGLGDAAAGLVAAATSAALGFGWGSAAVASSGSGLMGNSMDSSSSGSKSGSFTSGGSGGSFGSFGSGGGVLAPPAPVLPGPTTERGLRRLIGLEVNAFNDEGTTH